MPLDPITIGIMLLAVFLLGLSKGGFAGIGMMSTPLLSLAVSPAQAAGIILPILLFQDAISVVSYRHNFDGWNLRVMLPSAVLGILAAATTIALIDRGIFELLLGMLSVVFGVERLARSLAGPPQPHAPKRIVGMICGALAGFTSMVAHAGVPPFQFFVLPQRLPRDVFIGTSVMFYAAINWIKVPFFLSLGQVSRQTLVVSLALFPVAFASVLLGIALVRRISTDRFILLANVIMIGIGVLLIWRGLADQMGSGRI
jgi:uncharacterized protein